MHIKAGKEVFMQKLIKAFENVMVAITFAESGEYDAARKISVQEDAREDDAEVNTALRPTDKT